MSGGLSCCCKPKDRSRWVVTSRECNHSKFNGSHYTPSDWSAILCLTCGRWWRTKAGYVRTLRDATREEILAPSPRGGGPVADRRSL